MASDRWTFTDLNENEWRKPRVHIRVDAQFSLLAFTLIALAAMGIAYVSTLKPITLLINQESQTVLSNQARVAGVLDDAALLLAAEDQVFPALSAQILDHQPIAVRTARALAIQADGETLALRTQSATVADALREANLLLKPGDRVLIDGRLIEPTAQLVTPVNSTAQVAIKRAVPIEVNDNGAVSTLYTTAPTLGEALRQVGLVLYLGDSISPDLGTPVAPGWLVYIRRSRAATISVDGKTFGTRTRSDTIAGMLADEGIQLIDKDYTIPPATEIVRDGASVQVKRVREELITESEAIAYETVWQADPASEIDARHVVQAGAEGTKKRTIRTRYEDGREVRRSVDREWIETSPTTHIIAYGTKIIPRDLTLPTGQTITYWRKVRVLATSYTAATSGKARTHPEFGITATGMRAGTGIVAVDPRVINLRSRVYVPGYGLATVGDTGGSIKGRRVDLGYDEVDLVLWSTWVDVYLLTPAPPADQIHWIIADTPRERTSSGR